MKDIMEPDETVTCYSVKKDKPAAFVKIKTSLPTNDEVRERTATVNLSLVQDKLTY